MTFDSALLAKLDGITDLPTLPTVARAILQSANAASTNAADIGHLIERDVALAAKVLKLVNSAYYGFPRQIRSIQHAVVILGFNKVMNVVMTVAVFDLAKRRDDGLDIRRLWQHSLGAGLAAKAAAETIVKGVAPEEAFMGGLLHDIGKIVLDLHLSRDYQPVLERVGRDRVLLLDAERDVLGGVAHTRVGAWLAERWHLPPGLRDAIRYHHQPAAAAGSRALANAVHIGDVLTRAIEVGDGGDRRIPVLDAGVIQHHNLTAADLETALDRFLDELGRAGDFFALLQGSGGKTA